MEPKNMKVNGSHYHVSSNKISDLGQVNVFSVKLLVKMSGVCSADGKYCNDITSSCTNIQMQCMCISICLVLFFCTRSMYIFISLLLSHQMTVGELNEKPSSPRITCNHTHCVAAFTAPLYLASSNERDIVCCFLLQQHMGLFESMNI